MLGQEYAQVLSDAGAAVVLFDVVPQAEINKRVKAISSSGRNIVGMTIDIAKEKQVKEAVKKVIKRKITQ